VTYFVVVKHIPQGVAWRALSRMPIKMPQMIRLPRLGIQSLWMLKYIWTQYDLSQQSSTSSASYSLLTSYHNTMYQRR